jgi:hypothetical protein
MTKRLFDNCESSAPVFLFFIVFLLSAINCPLTTAFASTPGKDTLVNYDTTWTYVYDGGTVDIFYDAKCLSNGVCVCVGESVDSTSHIAQSILMKFDANGKVLQKKLYTIKKDDQYAHSLAIAKNGDFIIGGVRYLGPYIMRTDSLGNLKWATWYYDSVADKRYLKGNGVVNSICETKDGKIICAAGDPYPFNNSLPYNNYGDGDALLQ